MKIITSKPFWLAVGAFVIACIQSQPVAAILFLVLSGLAVLAWYDEQWGCFPWEKPWMQDDGAPLDESERERDRLPYD